MKISQSKKPSYSTEIRFVYQQGKPVAEDFMAEPATIAVRYQKKKTTIFAGLGDKKECADHSARSTAAFAIQKAIDLKRDHVSLCLGDINPEYHRSALEGAILGTYSFSKYQKEKPHQVKEIQIVSDSLSKKESNHLCRIG
jgi:leucyl aminopeptidase